MTSEKGPALGASTTRAAPTDRPPPMRRRAASDAPPRATADAAPLMPTVGDVVDGKYRIEARVGLGGMGVVVAARHLQLKQKVALKFLLPEGLRKRGVKERFLREARAAVAISSEHIARVLDVGALPNGVPFIVMEYLDGTDLARLLDERGTFSAEEATAFVLEACEAIAEAHALGIVHRDIKPSNLFLARRADGSSIVKVLDFGIAKSASDDAFSAELTQTNQSMGSPQYMSPEQVRDAKNVDARTDIWALGVVLYELVSGRAPFVAESLPALSAQIVADDVPPLASLVPDVPDTFAEVVHRCLEKDPRKRFVDVAELAEALRAFAPSSGRVVERISLLVGRDAHVDATRGTASGPGRTPTGPRTPPSVDGLARERPAPARASTVSGDAPTAIDEPPDRRTLWVGLAALAAVLGIGAFFLVKSVAARTEASSSRQLVDGSPSTPAPSAMPPPSSTDARSTPVARSSEPPASALSSSTSIGPVAPSARASATATPTARPSGAPSQPATPTAVATAKPKPSALPAPDPYGDRK